MKCRKKEREKNRKYLPRFEYCTGRYLFRCCFFINLLTSFGQNEQKLYFRLSSKFIKNKISILSKRLPQWRRWILSALFLFSLFIALTVDKVQSAQQNIYFIAFFTYSFAKCIALHWLFSSSIVLHARTAKRQRKHRKCIIMNHILVIEWCDIDYNSQAFPFEIFCVHRNTWSVINYYSFLLREKK